MRVSLSSGVTETYDLIVGADGLHSGIRAIALGDEAKCLKHHGYNLASCSHQNILGMNGKAVMYTVPGHSLMVSAGRALLICAGSLPRRDRTNPAAMRQFIGDAYRGLGWRTEAVLAALEDATDLYVDQIATVAVDRYAIGRVALLGNAAWGGTLGGQGTTLAIIGTYVLAGELVNARDDMTVALQRYEAVMRPYATRCQKGAKRVGAFFAPRTRFGLACRDRFYRAMVSRLLIGRFERMVKSSATAFQLPAYN